MADDVATLFDDYAARFARGERPDAREYLARAGPAADELGSLIERFLERVPPPPPDAETVAFAQAWIAGQPPLLELRTRRGLRRDEVVDALIERLGLDRAKRTKVKRYYHELEGGLLEPRGVDRSVFEALAETLRARVDDLLAWCPRSLGAEPAYFRLQSAPMPAPASAAPEPREEDEIDALFRKAH